MLAPDDRTLLVDLLAPPEPEMQLRSAVATTFTLDLVALLAIPMGLAGSDLSTAGMDPLAVLGAIRQYADRLNVFCQAGEVSVPGEANDLLTFIEPTVHQVKAPRDGVFHPKLWILRFADEGGEEMYRLVCGSRNLTRDRSWDTAISLEGRRTRKIQEVNKPLAELIRSLPARVPTGVDDSRVQDINDLVEGLRRVEWQNPEGSYSTGEWLKFHVFGRGRSARPRMDGYKRLVVSPFLTSRGLDEVWPGGSGACRLVSRPEEINALEGDARDLVELHATTQILNDQVAIADFESEESGVKWALQGLHSKLFVVERARIAHLFIGSANATGAAWSVNDEVLVEVTGSAKTFGVDAIVGSGGMESILQPHAMSDSAPTDVDDDVRFKIERMLRDLAALPWTATVDVESETELRLQSHGSVTSPEVGGADLTLSFRPLTVGAAVKAAEVGQSVDFEWLLSDMTEITPFFVASVRVTDGRNVVEASTVFLAKLINDPLDRHDRVLAKRFENPGEFLRFVMMLLQLAGKDEFGMDWGAGSGSGGMFGIQGEAEGALEAVLGALTESPDSIDVIDRLVRQLTATTSGQTVLPDGWDDFWRAVVTARGVCGAE